MGGTRALIGVKQGDGYQAVWHAYDSAPWQLGDHLLGRILRSRGDLRGLVDELVLGAPGGWRCLQRTERLTTPPPFLTPEDSLVHDVHWLYLFDLEARTLEIIDQADGSPWMTVRIDERGRPTPRQIPRDESRVGPAEIVPGGSARNLLPWSRVPTVEPGKACTEGHQRQRAGLAARLATALDDPEAARAKAATLILEVVDAPGPWFVQLQVGDPQAYWTGRLGDVEVHLPTDAWRDWAASMGAHWADTLVLATRLGPRPVYDSTLPRAIDPACPGVCACLDEELPNWQLLYWAAGIRPS